MCVFWHPRITPWHHFTNKTALKKLNEESGPNCFIDSTVKIFYCFGVYLFFFFHWKVVGWAPRLSDKKKNKKTCPDRRRWFFDFDQMIRWESAKGASVQRLTRTSHFCFLRQQEKEPHSDIPAEVKERQRSAVSPCTVLLQRKTHFRKKKENANVPGLTLKPWLGNIWNLNVAFSATYIASICIYSVMVWWLTSQWRYSHHCVERDIFRPQKTGIIITVTVHS